MKSKRAFLEFDTETVVAGAFGIVAGFISLIVMKSQALGFFWKIMTFGLTAVVAFFISYAIFTKD